MRGDGTGSGGGGLLFFGALLLIAAALFGRLALTPESAPRAPSGSSALEAPQQGGTLQRGTPPQRGRSDRAASAPGSPAPGSPASAALSEPAGVNEPARQAARPEARSPWVWESSAEEQRERGLIGLRLLDIYQRLGALGWERVPGARPVLVSAEGVQLDLVATRGRIHGARATFPSGALGMAAMPLWPLLFGQREAPIELAMGAESMTPGAEQEIQVSLGGGHMAQLTIYYQREGEGPFGPARVIVAAESLSLDAATRTQ